MIQSRCRHCSEPLSILFADLGATPVSNDYLRPQDRNGAEPYYPLRAFVCGSCRLVQLEDFRRADDLFREDYAYFSSVSTSWLAHAKAFAGAAAARYGLGPGSKVVEVASNDGYLLQYFKDLGIPVQGVEPCRSVADYAIQEKKIPTMISFFGAEFGAKMAAEGHAADLTCANNVLAHVPDINDFVSGFRNILKPEGVSTFEFPHLLRQIEGNQFDTIYHEHFSYLSLLAVSRIMAANGMRVFDVEELATHGGSLRLHCCRAEAGHAETARVGAVLGAELAAGLDGDEVYLRFGEKVRETKRSLLELLIDLKRQNKTIVGYGAPAKGNTLLNYCGIGADFLEFTVDRSPQKQGLFLPGTRLEIRDPSAIEAVKPDYILILPWNIRQEVMQQMAHVSEWGARFIVPIPRAEIL